MRRYQRCIGGYAGCGNLGDDAILQAYLRGLSLEQRRKTVVFSGNPRRDSRRFGVRCVGRKNPVGIVICLMRSRCFLCGGGSLLQNGTGNLSLMYYTGLLRLARMCGCETEILAGGVGPLRGEWAVRTVAGALKQCRRIEVRDEDSRDALEKWGLSPSCITLREDPALELNIPPPSRLACLKQEMRMERSQRYVCVAVRQGEGDALKTVEAALRRYRKCHGETEVVFLNFDIREDGAATADLQRRVGGKQAVLREAADALALISGSEGVISMRLHALIFSAAAGIPAIGISPTEEEPKLASFCRSRSIPHCSPSQLTENRILEVLL